MAARGSVKRGGEAFILEEVFSIKGGCRCGGASVVVDEWSLLWSGDMSDGICALAAQGALHDEDGVSGSGLLVGIVGK